MPFALLLVGAAVIIVSMLVALESALIQARRGYLSTGSSVGPDTGPESPVQVTLAEFILAARLTTSLLFLVAGAVLGRAWGVYFSSAGEGAAPLVGGEHLVYYSLAVVVGVIVLSAILVGAYLIPFQIGSRFSEKAIQALSPFGLAIVRVMLPMMLLSRLLGRLGAAKDTHPGVVEEEALEDDIRSLVEEGERAGVIEEEEREIITRVFKLGDKPVISIMTPRTDVVALRASMTPDEALAVVLGARYTWYPVFNDDESDVLGVVSAHDVFEARRGDGRSRGWLTTVVSTAMDVPESMTALELLERFKELGSRFAVVRDEYGTVVGIATVDDVLKVIVGELGDAYGETRSIVRRDDGSFLVDASSDVQNLFEFLGFSDRAQDDAAPFHSVGGFVMTSLGRIPKEGEAFLHQGYRFEVIDMDGKRIDKVLIARCESKSVVGE